MPLEVSYRGERFALEYGSGKRAALRLLPADPLAGVPADWRDAAPRLRRLRSLQLLLLMGLGTASVAAAGTFIALIDSAAPGAGEGQVHRLGLGLVGTLSGIVAVGLALWPPCSTGRPAGASIPSPWPRAAWPTWRRPIR